MLALIVIGGLAGWVASMIMKTDGSMGIILNIIVGIAGAFVGTFLLRLIGGPGYEGFTFVSFLVALLGSCALLALIKAFDR